MAVEKRFQTAASRRFRGNNKRMVHQRPQQAQFGASGANAEPIRSRLDRSQSVEDKMEVDDEQTGVAGVPDYLAKHFSRLVEDTTSRSNDLPFPPPPPPPPNLSKDKKQTFDLIPGLTLVNLDQESTQKHAETVIIEHESVPGPEPGAEESSPKDSNMMIANGSHPSHRHQQPHRHVSQDRRNHATDIVSPTNRASNGPMPSHLQVAKPFVFQQAIEGCMHDLGVTQTREDNIRLAGIKWIDDTRRALKLPVRTFDTAAVYYHKFRLSHADNEYNFLDAAAAALFAACKIEDTLKKSRDILCAAHNAKVGSRADHLPPDDPLFEHQSRNIIGLERLMLEASSFDFRNRHPQPLIVKIARKHNYEKHSAITKTAYKISLDLYRTFAPLKQSTPTMALACLELAGRLHGQEKVELVSNKEYARWSIDRAMALETLLDLLELYTNYRNHTSVAPQFDADAFLNIQISLQEELTGRHMPRFTEYITNTKGDKAGYAGAAPHGGGQAMKGPGGRNGLPPPGLPQLMNGSLKASPTSSSPASASPSTPGIRQRAGERGKEGTVRFMLNPDREREEKEVTGLYAPLLAQMRGR